MTESVDPPVSVVVLNYRNHADTIRCVRSLEDSDYGNLSVIVVDNDSDNGSEEVLRRTFPQHVVLQSGRNGGYAAGNNVGLRRALDDGAAYVMILNNDAIVEPGSLSALVAFATGHPRAGVLSPMILTATGTPSRTCTRRRPRLREILCDTGVARALFRDRPWMRRSRYEDEYDFEGPRNVEVVSGSCLMLRRTLLEQIGLLDENTFLFFEELILAEKVRGTEFETVVVPTSRVVHGEGRSVRTIGSRASIEYMRSLNYYLREYRDVRLVTRLAVLSIVAASYAPGILKTVTGARKVGALFGSGRRP